MSTCTRYTQQLVRRHFTLDAAFPTTLELFREASTAALKSEVSSTQLLKFMLLLLLLLSSLLLLLLCLCCLRRPWPGLVNFNRLNPLYSAVRPLLQFVFLHHSIQPGWSVCLSACLSICLSVRLSACLSVCLSVTLSVCVSVTESGKIALSAILAVCLCVFRQAHMSSQQSV